MIDVKIYVLDQVLDLFKDEEITIESSVQNVQDIAKIFSDFTPSFTVPCTPQNNKIAEYFYDYDLDGNIDHNIRQVSFIEIEGIPFRSGKIQIEKVNEKNGLPESYTYTFYGSMTSLKDKIGDDKISDLPWDAYSHFYNGNQVRDRITGDIVDNVKYPLISSSRVWQYGDSTTNDIGSSGGAIRYDELFPALSLPAIMSSIQLKYGITFSGNFLTDPRFTNTYLHLKNAEQFQFWTPKVDVDFTTKTGAYPDYINIFNNTANYAYDPSTLGNISFSVVVNPSSPAVVWAVDVYLNGSYNTTITGTGYQANMVFLDANQPGLNNSISLKVKANSEVDIQINATVSAAFTTGIRTETGHSDIISLSGNINLNQYAPDMKVDDYLRGIFKQFNLTAYGLSSTEFLIEPLEDFYYRGQIIDISKYVTIESIDKERVPAYKNVVFTRQTSDSFMNVAYKQAFGREYGDLKYNFPYDSDDYTIDLPFSNLLFNKFTGTPIQVGYYLSTAPDFKPYVPKPTLISTIGTVSSGVSFYFYDGVGTTELNDYQEFGQDVVNLTRYSLNFGAETSSYYGVVITNGAYQTYYQPYLSNVFNRKARLTRLKAILPIGKMTIKLNDRPIIRDHRFIINSMKVNMNTGEVDFVLINDFRSISTKRIPVRSFGGHVLVSIPLKNGAKSFAISDPQAFGIIPSETSGEEDKNIDFYVPTISTLRVTEIEEDRETELTDTRIIEEDLSAPYSRSIYAVITYTNEDGSTQDEQIWFDYVD